MTHTTYAFHFLVVASVCGFCLWLITPLLSVAVSAPSETQCVFGLDIIDCIFKVGHNMDSKDLSRHTHFRETEEQVNKMCSDLLPLAKCVAGVAKNCDTEPKPLMKIYQDEYDVLGKLCNKKSDFRREYLKHAKCMNAHKAEYEGVCLKALTIPIEMPGKEECLKYTSAVKTCEEKVAKPCGMDAVIVARETFKSTRNFVADSCGNSQ